MEPDTRRFTSEELAIAKSADLCDVASSLGYTVKRIGRYHTLKEMDSIRIYDRRSWYRWSRQGNNSGNGGSQIDFLKTFAGLETKDAVFWLLDFVGYSRLPDTSKELVLKHQAKEPKKTQSKAFILPAPARDNRYLYNYLNGERAISKEVIDFFVKKGLIYEAAGYHNIVFKGNDKEGNTKFASMRGVFDGNGKPFKCDVAGNNKLYGFNVVREGSKEVYVFEAAIDAMSYMDIFQDYENNLLALGMVSDAPLATFLFENPQIGSIKFCLDNDEAGRKATEELMEKYYGRGYEVEDKAPPKMYKDYNEWLKEAKKKQIRPPEMQTAQCR